MSGKVFEAVMMVCFGVSWPISILKTVQVKNPAGKSIVFMWLIILGYLCGIAGKVVSGNISWVIWLYALNTLMVGTDLILVYIYRARRRAAGNDLK